jgi:hypothetical protein
VLSRLASGFVALLVVAFTVIVFPQPALASSEAAVAAGLCSVEEWQADPGRCISELPQVAGARVACLNPPPPDAPDSGLGGWFAERPAQAGGTGIALHYTDFGYAGYEYTTYDIGCAQTLMHPDYKFENTVANGEFLAATAIIGASNALRERAWDPGLMWGWADPLVKSATQALYNKVFTVFGAITLAVIGIYLLWRSRQAQMNTAVTTVAWALLVMVAVTALARWPENAAHVADTSLVASLDAVHNAVGPGDDSVPAGQCEFADPNACKDSRSPALRASDTAVETMLYRNYLRGLLGSADSTTAQKYGNALYRARTLSWTELDAARSDPAVRNQMIKDKADQWEKVAEQIKTEDPEAYQYLQGEKGMERIGAGFIALLSALMFAMFDLTASLLVLLGFLIIRWAIIAAPLIGTIGMLRPASGGFRRLAHSVVAALFNIIVFGTGAAIYLHAVDLIMNSTAIAGWLQVVLVLLCGVVGWMLLRPYRRITQLGGKDPLAAIAAGGLFNRRQARLEEAAAGAAAAARDEGGRIPPVREDARPLRIEVNDPSSGLAGGGPAEPGGPSRFPIRVPDPREPDPRQPGSTRPGWDSPTGPQRVEVPVRTGEGWSEPAAPEPAYALYRPHRSPVSTPPTVDNPAPPGRVESRTEV